jgi:N-acetylmuramoyl-L-alanine amidase
MVAERDPAPAPAPAAAVTADAQAPATNAPEPVVVETAALANNAVSQSAPASPSDITEGPVIKNMPAEVKKVGRQIIVAIDAGHGGEDPGANGANGSREKDITLMVAKKLKQQIDAEPNMRAVLTRDGDYFIP